MAKTLKFGVVVGACVAAYAAYSRLLKPKPLPPLPVTLDSNYRLDQQIRSMIANHLQGGSTSLAGQPSLYRNPDEQAQLAALFDPAQFGWREAQDLQSMGERGAHRADRGNPYGNFFHYTLSRLIVPRQGGKGSRFFPVKTSKDGSISLAVITTASGRRQFVFDMPEHIRAEDVSLRRQIPDTRLNYIGTQSRNAFQKLTPDQRKDGKFNIMIFEPTGLINAPKPDMALTFKHPPQIVVNITPLANRAAGANDYTTINLPVSDHLDLFFRVEQHITSAAMIAKLKASAATQFHRPPSPPESVEIKPHIPASKVTPKQLKEYFKKMERRKAEGWK